MSCKTISLLSCMYIAYYILATFVLTFVPFAKIVHFVRKSKEIKQDDL